jgi:RHS repeat-associated protein
LLNVILPDSTLIEYIHDPMGRRIAKKINGAIAEKYLWQGLTRLLAVYDSEDNLLMRFEYANDRVPLSMRKGGIAYYLSYDPVGSLRLVADETGNVVKRIAYDAFGNIVLDTNPLFDIPFGFGGGFYDKDTGLFRFGYRDYNPATGRWTAKDPILFEGGNTDLYGYCLNDPINAVDPIGLWSSQQFLNDTAAYAGIAATVSFLSPGGQVPAIILVGISTGAIGIEIALYSSNPIVDSLWASLKMIVPINKPYDLFTDHLLDILKGEADLVKPCE